MTTRVCFMVLASYALAEPFAPPTGKELADAGASSAQFAAHPGDQAAKAATSGQDLMKFEDKSKGPQKTFTEAEVAQFDGEAGRPLYIVFMGKVLDVTDYAELHPAGPKPLKHHAGQDATEAMKASAMPAFVYDFIDRFKVGQIQSDTTDDAGE